MSREYFIVCANPACRQVKPVRRPSDQRTRRFCSRRCANVMHCNLTKEAARRGGLTYGHRRRQRLVQAVQGLTPLAAFRKGYDLGFEAAKRKLLKKYLLTKRDAA